MFSLELLGQPTSMSKLQQLCAADCHCAPWVPQGPLWWWCPAVDTRHVTEVQAGLFYIVLTRVPLRVGEIIYSSLLHEKEMGTQTDTEVDDEHRTGHLLLNGIFVYHLP